MTTVVALVLGGLAVGLASAEIWLFAVAVGVLHLLCLYGALGLWLQRVRVSANHEGLHVKRSILGVGRTRTIHATELVGVDAEAQTVGSSPLYFVRASRSTQRPVIVATGIQSQTEAEAISAALSAALGLKR